MHTKLVIFGITGDLSSRKLLPALHHIVKGQENPDISVIGISRREVDVPALVKEATGAEDLLPFLSVTTMNVAHVDDYIQLKEQLAVADDEQLVVYLSVPPSAAADIADFLGQAGINGPNVKLLFEKPFGYDYASAKEYIARTDRHFIDEHIYRIDHFMAKDVALGIVELRKDAENHHHHWSCESVSSVKVVAHETIDIEGRVDFFEQTGALRDVVQGHLMQLLSLVLLDPSEIENELPARRCHALAQLSTASDVPAIRAQYEGYEDEVKNSGSSVETFISVQLRSADARWQGVPLTLETGKALSEKQVGVTIEYTDGTKDVFTEVGMGPAPGDRKVDAYERVFAEAIKGNRSLFTTEQEVLESWRILAPIQEAIAYNQLPLHKYKKGASAASITAPVES